jgi:hypothetical protein
MSLGEKGLNILLRGWLYWRRLSGIEDIGNVKIFTWHYDKMVVMCHGLLYIEPWISWLKMNLCGRWTSGMVGPVMKARLTVSIMII